MHDALTEPRLIMHPRIWGRDMWRSIHYVALGYPVRDPTSDVRASYSTFFGALGFVLPCAKCSQHYNKHIVSYPLDPSLVGRAELFRWTVDLHNAVNSSLGRKTWTYEQAYELYADRRSVQDPTYSAMLLKTATMVLSVLIICSLIFWWIRRRRLSNNRH